MSFSIVNNSAVAVITSIGTQTVTDGSFSVTGGSFPLFSGQTVTGTNTTIQDRNGADQATILLFLQQGNAQINLYVNGTLISANDYSSGLIEVKAPILLSSDNIGIQVDETTEPVPSPTPSVTPTNTPTPSTTAAVTPTPTNTGTPTNTPTNTNTPTPTSSPSAVYRGIEGVSFYPQDDTTVLSACTGNFYANGILLTRYAIFGGVPYNPAYSGTGLSDFSTGGTANITLSAAPQSGFYLTSYPATSRPPYDEQRLTGFTYAGLFSGKKRWTGTTQMYSGGTLVDTEANAYIELQTNGNYILGATGVAYPDTSYFYGMPTP